MKPLRYFFDTEFIDTADGTYPVSIGIVCEDGREFYGELTDALIPWDKADQWVLDNVQPLLHRTYETTYQSKESLAKAIRLFVDKGEQPPQFWAYFGDYDWIVLMHLFGRITEQPDGWPMMAMDLKQWAVMMGDPKLPEQRGAIHDALADAKWNKKVWDFLDLHSRGTGWHV